MSMHTCLASGCLVKTGTPDIVFFSLPNDPERRRQWLLALNRQDLIDNGLKRINNGVCSLHFKKTDLIEEKIKVLDKDALPSKQYKSGDFKNKDSVESVETQTNDAIKREERSTQTLSNTNVNSRKRKIKNRPHSIPQKKEATKTTVEQTESPKEDEIETKEEPMEDFEIEEHETTEQLENRIVQITSEACNEPDNEKADITTELSNELEYNKDKIKSEQCQESGNELDI